MEVGVAARHRRHTHHPNPTPGHVKTAPPAHSAPVANAGSDITVEAGATYVLTGSHSDVDGGDTITSRAWILAGDTVSTSTTVTATAPVTLTGTTLTYTYQVTDDQDATGTDTVVVTVLPASLRIKTAGIIRPGIRRTP